ncbi:MAG: hypothetical protein ACRDS0_38560 [Pseudonocardiaceae bacterium]
MRRRSVYLQAKVRRTAAIFSGVAAAVLLAITTSAPATAATVGGGFLCGVTGDPGTPRVAQQRRGTPQICAVVDLPDLPGIRTPSP